MDGWDEIVPIVAPIMSMMVFSAQVLMYFGDFKYQSGFKEVNFFGT